MGKWTRHTKPSSNFDPTRILKIFKGKIKESSYRFSCFTNKQQLGGGSRRAFKNVGINLYRNKF